MMMVMVCESGTEIKDLKSGIPQETEMPAPEITTILEQLCNAARQSSKEVNFVSCLRLPCSINLVVRLEH
jgi:hypothetical protein